MKKLFVLAAVSIVASLGFKKVQSQQVRQAWQESTDSI